VHVGGRVSVVLVGGPAARRAALERAGVEVLAAVPAPGAVTGEPHVVVVDLDDVDPATIATAVATVTAAVPGAAVLAVAAAPAHAAVLTAVRAGAAGFVGPDEVAAAVPRLAAGDPVFSPGLAAVVLEARLTPGASGLTDRETEVLTLVVEGLTARQIATRLVLSPRTVENHVQNVLRKLRLPNRAALVRYAIENGLA
jgi:DNA-binding NarL/FixJ family response regulator